MRATLKNILLLTGLILSIAACTNDDMNFSLPAKTEAGRNTLGFMTGGKVWVNYGDICNWGKCDDNVVEGRLHTYPDNSKAVIIQAYYNNKRESTSQIFQINARNIVGVGTYLLSNEKEEAMNLITDGSKNLFYINLQDSNAKLIITRLDTVNHIIAGEFSGKLYSYHDSTTAIDITDGRFDTKLTYSKF